MNKNLFVCYLLVLVLTQSRSNRQETPTNFERFPTVYYATQVSLAVGFFTSFVGLITHSRDHKLSRFCGFYSCFCLGLVLFLYFIVGLAYEFGLPSWCSKQFYMALITLSNPFPLFSVLVLAMTFCLGLLRIF